MPNGGEWTLLVRAACSTSARRRPRFPAGWPRCSSGSSGSTCNGLRRSLAPRFPTGPTGARSIARRSTRRPGWVWPHDTDPSLSHAARRNDPPRAAASGATNEGGIAFCPCNPIQANRLCRRDPPGCRGYCKFGPGQRPVSTLWKSLGDRTILIDAVVLTHAHWDHIQILDPFSEAMFPCTRPNSTTSRTRTPAITSTPPVGMKAVVIPHHVRPADRRHATDAWRLDRRGARTFGGHHRRRRPDRRWTTVVTGRLDPTAWKSPGRDGMLRVLELDSSRGVARSLASLKSAT